MRTRIRGSPSPRPSGSPFQPAHRPGHPCRSRKLCRFQTFLRFSLKRWEATSEAPPPRSPAQERACSAGRGAAGANCLRPALTATQPPRRRPANRRTHRSGVPSEFRERLGARGAVHSRHPADMACSRALPRSYRRPRSRRASRVVTSASPTCSPRRSGELRQFAGRLLDGRRTRCLQDSHRLTLGVTGQPRLALSA